MLFRVPYVLSGKDSPPSTSDIEQEKKYCGSGANSGEGQTCELILGNSKFHFSWFWSVMSDPWKSALLVPADLVVFNVGSHYLFRNDSDAFERAKIEVSLLLAAMEASPITNFIFRTSTRVCRDCYDQSMVSLNENIVTMNAIITSAIRASRSKKVQIFNAWRDNSSCIYYDDHVHSSQLAYMQFTELAGLLCGAGETKSKRFQTLK